MSFILTEDIALHHLLHVLPPSAVTPSSANITSLERAHSPFLNSYGHWVFNYYERSFTWRWNEQLHNNLRGSMAYTAYYHVHNWIETWSLQSLVEGMASVHPDPSDLNYVLAYDQSSLIIPPLIQKTIAENCLLAILRSTTLPNLPQPSSQSHLISSSDTSMLPSSPNASQPLSVIFSSNTPFGSAAYSLLLYHNSASVPLGEVYSLLTCLLSLLHHSSPSPSVIYTNHLNSSHLVTDALTSPPLSHSWTVVFSPCSLFILLDS
ncbi:hypothetical protein EV360DRAFT_86918 [Lentinula raphanica]|nr:hypothetical protein EV360DRAFT_86918 [Lentinula raphanica]